MSILHLSPYFYCSVLYSVRIWMLVLISHTAHCVYTLMRAYFNMSSFGCFCEHTVCTVQVASRRRLSSTHRGLYTRAPRHTGQTYNATVRRTVGVSVPSRPS